MAGKCTVTFSSLQNVAFEGYSEGRNCSFTVVLRVGPRSSAANRAQEYKGASPLDLSHGELIFIIEARSRPHQLLSVTEFFRKQPSGIERLQRNLFPPPSIKAPADHLQDRRRFHASADVSVPANIRGSFQKRD
ncbi:hypothetical protein Bbelb_138320 [Branchiostoma belcheri]|nr:hypothetical protein Bbelb_138320 [Branchiostoma belcheri]